MGSEPLDSAELGEGGTAAVTGVVSCATTSQQVEALPSLSQVQLEEVRRAALVRRCRVTGTSLILGLLILIPGLNLHFLSSDHAHSRAVSFAVLPVGASFFVIAVLPQDRCAIRCLALGGVLYFAFAATVLAQRLRSTFTSDCTVMGWACDGYRVYLCLGILIDCVIAGLFLRTNLAVARDALAMFYRILGCQWCCFALILPIELVCRRRWEICLGMVSYAVFGTIFLHPRARERAQAALSRQGDAVNVASLIGGFLGGNADMDGVRKDSQRFFRYVFPEDLTFSDMLAATSGLRSQELFERSHPALIGEIDAFVSHSWHDDPQMKWDALQAWCNNFSHQHGRSPKLWLDFCCIEQRHIDAGLRCLPVYLAGCNSFLLIAGQTYCRRLWCAIELFVFVSIRGSGHRLEVCALGKTEEEHKLVCQTFRNFNVVQCECSKAEDKQRLQGIVEAGSGTMDRFNKKIRRMLGDLQVTDSITLARTSLDTTDSTDPV